MHRLPVLIPGHTEPVSVPFELPDSFTVAVYLPSRGLRHFTAWLDSSDPLKTSVDEVVLCEAEGDPRGPEGYLVDADEEQRAWEAADSALGALLNCLGLRHTTRKPMPPTLANVLTATASAYVAECAAFEALCTAHVVFNGPLVPFIAPDPASGDSYAVRLLAAYAAKALERCQLEAERRAKAIRDANGGDEDAPGSERIRNARALHSEVLQ